VVLEQGLVRAEAEAQLSNITREKLKAAYTNQFDALCEHCEKLAIIAGYGKHLLELIDGTPVAPGETRAAYHGSVASKLLSRTARMTNWVIANAAVSLKLSTHSHTHSHHHRANIHPSTNDHGLTAQGGVTLNNAKSGLWDPTSVHDGSDLYDEEKDVEGHREASVQTVGVNGETRDRQDVVIVA
jgi:hypothetical protein